MISDRIKIKLMCRIKLTHLALLKALGYIKMYAALLHLIIFCFIMDCIIAFSGIETYSDLRKQSNETAHRIWNKIHNTYDK